VVDKKVIHTPNLDFVMQDLTDIYGQTSAKTYTNHFKKIITELWALPNRCHTGKALNEQDAILITYGDSILPESGNPLQALEQFLNKFIGEAVNTIHILPFCPYSSDDGFSVIDYLQVNKDLGNWKDIESIGNSYQLMFDLVANHISQESSWFQKYLTGDSIYQEYFVEVENNPDLSEVFRPRALPLLTEFQTSRGPKKLWTTFSDDQIDLNYANPEVLLNILTILKQYIIEGASFIRLDAIAFIWKEIGTRCLHHPNTHRIIKLIRKILEAADTGVHMITETNVPHQENISYFGNGYDEASMVYNFSLPPLTLHAFMTGSVSCLSNWAANLEFPSDQVTYFNFLASHDGIGLMPVTNLLPHDEIESLADKIVELGGFVSRRTTSDGSTVPYELNCSFLDALKPGNDENISIDLEAQRFIASQSIMLALKGVPGIYIHSLIGSGNWIEGPELTGMPRSINREKIPIAFIRKEFQSEVSLRKKILEKYIALLTIRSDQQSFNPSAPQNILFLHDSVFTVKRFQKENPASILCMTNVSNEELSITIPPVEIMGEQLTDLITDTIYKTRINNPLKVTIQPYQVIWLLQKTT
jgi:glucosylglycerate phosphorylase